MLVEAAVAIGSGMRAHSLSLLSFGADSVIELGSAGVLLWRLAVEIRTGSDFPEAVERRASRIAGALLFALAAYVIASAGYGFATQKGQEFSLAGLIVTSLAIPIMAFLAKAKLRIAEEIESPALRADAVESIGCASLSAVVAVGMLAQAAFGAWWIDGATSLAILWFLLKEAREAWAEAACEAAPE